MTHKGTKMAMKDLATAFPAVTGYYKEARRIRYIAENYSKLKLLQSTRLTMSLLLPLHLC